MAVVMIKCCGAEHATRFCPHCGTSLVMNPLALLRKHVLSTIGSFQERLRRYPGSRVEVNNRAITKWTAWLQALDHVIADKAILVYADWLKVRGQETAATMLLEEFQPGPKP